MKIYVNENRVIGDRDIMIYGHFIEHFHRQIYGGIFDSDSPYADEDGFRQDVIDAMKKIKVPILRWPGGCFVSTYNWKKAVGSKRTPMFDKTWRVEDPNTFGTDEYIKMCRKIGCKPYICTNAGTGSPEEMSDWVEYCNLEHEGEFAKWRIENGEEKPYAVKYWSIGNENYGHWELGAKSAEEWGGLVRESSKMIKHVDPTTELTAAALTDLDWNINLLRNCSEYLDWISIHEYWDMIHETNDYATYEQCMAYTKNIGHSIDEIRGLLSSMKLDKKIKISFDEWNLRGWYHPNAHTVKQGVDKKDYLYPRDENDDNSKYTMADAVFTACFLNVLNRNCDIVGMANFAPIVNTRGCINTAKEGLILRSTYHVFDLYVNYMGDIVIDLWADSMPEMSVRNKENEEISIASLDIVATKYSDESGLAIAIVNKESVQPHEISISAPYDSFKAVIHSINGVSTESYNDFDREEVSIVSEEQGNFNKDFACTINPHSVNVIQILKCEQKIGGK